MPETWGKIKTAAKIGVRRFAAWRKKSGVHPVCTGAHTAYFFFFAAAFLAAGFLAAVFFAAAFFLAAMCISLLSMFGCSVFFPTACRSPASGLKVKSGKRLVSSPPCSACSIPFLLVGKNRALTEGSSKGLRDKM